MGTLHRQHELYSKAEPLFKAALSIHESMFGADDPATTNSLNNLAELYFAQGDWRRAWEHWRRSTSINLQRMQRGTAVAGKVAPTDNEMRQLKGLIKAAYRLPDADRIALAAEIFELAQWATSSEQSQWPKRLRAMQKSDMGETRLVTLLRTRQRLVEEWQKRETLRRGGAAQDKRNVAAESENVRSLVAIDTLIRDVDARLLAEYLGYLTLARPTAMWVADVQSLLVLMTCCCFLTHPRGNQLKKRRPFGWSRRQRWRWVRSGLGTEALTHQIAALRCDLDTALWDDEAAAARCRHWLMTEPTRDTAGNVRSETLPFNQARASAVYRGLFGQVEDLIRNKHLLLVLSGPLTQLPLHLLVTSLAGTGYRSTPWLARTQSLVVLPAVPSLKALRRISPRGASFPIMFGIGNPLLDGSPGAQLARKKQVCPQIHWPQVVGAGKNVRAVEKVSRRGGFADLDHLRSQRPLHDTADELCAVAEALRAGPDDVALGAKATETTIKTLSNSGAEVIKVERIGGEETRSNGPTR
jgi:hypothetical protein